MQIRTNEDARANIEGFAAEFLELLLTKKSIDAEIKEVKQRWAEEGVPVGIVSNVLNKIKVDKKKSDSEKFEIDTIKEWLESNQSIDNIIGVLVAK